MALLDSLNPQQREAAEVVGGPLLIQAGAGSGKTRTVVYRIAHLIEQGHVTPKDVLAVTFTNKAAAEMKERLEGLLGKDQAKGVWAMTFHALCARILRRDGMAVGLASGWTILDSDDSRKLVALILKKGNEEEERDVSDSARSFSKRISKYTNAGMVPEDVQLGDYELYQIWTEYLQRMTAMRATDFDGLLSKALQVVENSAHWQHRFPFITVDEYQDCNKVQIRLLRALACSSRNLCVVGDFQQCQPGATQVTTQRGLVSMDKIDAEKDQLLFENTLHSFDVNQRLYTGDLYTISTSHLFTQCTRNHHWPVQWRKDGFLHMLEQQGSRLYTRSYAMSDIVSNHLAGDASWILDWTPDAQANIDLVSDKEFSTFKEQYPSLNGAAHFIRGVREDYSLLPAYLLDPSWHRIFSDKGEMLSFSISRQTVTNTPVYSVEVAPHHRYYADGLLSCNSIYGFRGAQPGYILQFSVDWPGGHAVQLDANYRCSPAILEAANAILVGAPGHMPLTAARKTESHHKAVRLIAADNALIEADLVASTLNKAVNIEGRSASDYAIVYRTNAQSRLFEEALNRKGVPYHLLGSTGFWQRTEVQALRAYIGLLANPWDESALRRVLQAPRRGVGDKSLDALVSAVSSEHSLFSPSTTATLKGKAKESMNALTQLLADAQSTATLSEALTWIYDRSGIVEWVRTQDKTEEREANLVETIDVARRFDRLSLPAAIEVFLESSALSTKGERSDGVALLTIHATKGLEWPHVWVVGAEQGLFVSSEASDDELEEARRLLYVAMTRAQDGLVISWARTRMRWGAMVMDRPLEFLDMLPASVSRHSAKAATKKNAAPHPYRSASLPRSVPPQRHVGLPASNYKVGMRASHSRFGVGSIVKVETDRVHVRFGSKTMVLDPQISPMQPLT